MSQIDIIILIASLASAGAGAVISKSLPLRFSVIVNVALMAWLGRGFAILNGDQTIAGDYWNGITYATAIFEIIVAIGWMMICSCAGSGFLRLYNRFRAGN